jgi:hypothetical protein
LGPQLLHRYPLLLYFRRAAPPAANRALLFAPPSDFLHQPSKRTVDPLRPSADVFEAELECMVDAMILLTTEVFGDLKMFSAGGYTYHLASANHMLSDLLKNLTQLEQIIAQ